MTVEQIEALALEIIDKGRICNNCPYSYDGFDYWSAEELIKRIIKKTSKTMYFRKHRVMYV